MSRLSLTCVAVLGAAAAVAWQLPAWGVEGGSWGTLHAMRTGVVAGALLGAAVALLGQALLAHTVDEDLEAGLRAVVIAFGAKLFFLVAFWALLAFVPAAGALASAQTFALGYAVAAVAVLLVGSFEHLRALHGAADTVPQASAPATSGETPS